MIEEFVSFSNLIAPIFYKIVYMSLVGSILGIFIFAITKLFDSKLSAKWKCILWLIPLCFLAVPMNRIQVQTESEFVIPTFVNEVESSFNKVHSLNSKEILKEEDSKKNVKDTKVETSNQESTEAVINGAKKFTVDILIPILWVIGAGISVSIVIIGNFHLKRNINDMPNMENSRIRLILKRCQRRLQVTKKIEIRIQNENVSPCIYGIMRPKILLSEEFMEKDTEVIENVFMHELSHYKRKDMISNYVLLLLIAMHWFNPLVYVFFKKIRQEMELATDEIALSRMDKEEKKQYGLTLISLLQTYQTERVATKMLCITDDNKNMERRIRRIKLSTQLKKYKMSIAVLTILIVFCIASLFVLEPTNAEIISKKEQNLYEQVKQYLIELEKEDFEQREENITTNQENFKTFIDIQELGIETKENETYVYVWALIQNYYLQEEIATTGSSMPYKFTIKDNKIISYEIPEDGDRYEESMERIFPKEIRNKMEKGETLLKEKNLKKQAEKQYNQFIEGNANTTKNIMNSNTYLDKESLANENQFEGKWKPYKAEDGEGKEINIMEIYGSGMQYGGELILNVDRTYTEFIGVYSEDIIDTLQGTYEVYGNGNKGLLTADSGDLKTIEIVDDSANIMRVTDEVGNVVYFSR